jgi:hypothetical protein
MAGDLSIEQRTPIRKLGSRPCGPSGAFSPSTRGCKRSLRVNSSWIGRRNKIIFASGLQVIERSKKASNTGLYLEGSGAHDPFRPSFVFSIIELNSCMTFFFQSIAICVLDLSLALPHSPRLPFGNFGNPHSRQAGAVCTCGRDWTISSQ